MTTNNDSVLFQFQFHFSFISMWEPPEPVNLQWIDKLLGCLFLLRLITLQCLRLMICERTKVEIFDCRISVILASAQRSLAKCRLGPQLLASPPHPHPKKNLPWRPLCDNLLAVFTARYLYTDSTHKVAEKKLRLRTNRYLLLTVWWRRTTKAESSTYTV